MKGFATRNRHIQLGNQAEKQACQYLQANGLSLLETNFRSRCGEIDLIMQQGNTLVFVEVRYRKHSLYGGALESITTAKQNKIRRTAEIFLQLHPQYTDCRFDVIAACPCKASQSSQHAFHFEWIQNAF